MQGTTAPKAEFDIFVSYAGRDRSAIAPVVLAFERAGLTVWWDQRLERGYWAAEIEGKIKACRLVVAFLTESAINSTYDFIFAEMRAGREQQKLVPVRIGNFRIPLAYEGLIALVQNYAFPNANDIVGHPIFARLCHACRADTADLDTLSDFRNAGDRVGTWFSRSPSLELLSFCTALAVLENAPISQVQHAAGELSRMVQAEQTSRTGLHGDSIVTHAGREVQRTFLPRSTRLAESDAEIFFETHPRLGVSLECCRFMDGDRSSAFLAFVWKELDDLREQLIRWLDHLAGTLPAEGRTRLSLALGVLAQQDFATVFERILRRWIVDEHGARREAADIAFSVACFEPTVANAIRRILTDWSNTSTSTRFLKAAVEMSCGYTGMRMPELAIDTLKAASRAKSKDLSLVGTMEMAIDQLMSAALEIGDNSLLDLPRLVSEFADWIDHSDAGEAQRLPIYLFLHTLEDLPITSPAGVAGVLSVAALMVDERTRGPCTRIFAAALRDAGDGKIGPREHASTILRRWAEMQQDADSQEDPVLALARRLVKDARTQRDRDRCIFIFRRIYPAEVLLDQAPTEGS
jgi:hypothetical protein